MDRRSKITRYFILAVVIGLIIGYFAGREHLKHQMRVMRYQSGSGSYFGTKPPADDTHADNGQLVEQAPIDNAPQGKIPASKIKESQVFKVDLIRKGFHEHDFQNKELQDLITFSVSFENIDNKDIRAFDGVLTFCDLLDNHILSCSLAITNPVPAGGTTEWNGQLNYIPFLDPHQKLRYENKANLKVAFSPIKIVFADGTTRLFDYNQQ